MSIARTPEQNGVVERRNHTLIEVARTMLSAAKVLLLLWAEAIATTCFTQNHRENLDKMKEKVVSKSFAVSAADKPDQCQEHNTTLSTSTTVAADTLPLNIQTTPGSTSQAPTVTSTENINQVETLK
ncbi:retrovirus-related pol polyprotein from transposon TNT 1-94 [Tanacetum coccineum]